MVTTGSKTGHEVGRERGVTGEDETKEKCPREGAQRLKEIPSVLEMSRQTAFDSIASSAGEGLRKDCTALYIKKH